MRGPDGNEMPNLGVYLEVVKNERLVFTDAYTKAWEPSEKPFMTVILTGLPCNRPGVSDTAVAEIHCRGRCHPDSVACTSLRIRSRRTQERAA